MKLPAFFVNRPVFTAMVAMMTLLLGLVALSRLPIDLMPDITYPTVSITTTYADADPEIIEELITRRIEEAVGAVPGVEEITSISSEGMSNVRVSFTWGTNLDAAAADVRDRLDRVVPRLPDDADRPTLRKFDLASFPILMLGVASDLDPMSARLLVDDQVKYRIERVHGVASMDILGGLEREIHIEVDIAKIQSLGLSLDSIVKRVRENNVNIPAGNIEEGRLDVRVRTPGNFDDLAELAELVVGQHDSAPVRLRHVASVENSHREVSQIVRINGEPGMVLMVNKQSGTNTVAVASAVLAEVRRINRDIPHINVVPVRDTSEYIKRAIANLASAAIIGGMFAVLVLLFFLRDWRATVVVAVSIPLSIVATFAMVYFGGLTLNIMTLGGLALGVGMLVDNSIVVIENIARWREDGKSPRLAAAEGASEVTTAILASTLTTLAVFLPLVFVRGMAGVMFKQLSLVVGFSLLCSFGVAVSIVPMLAAKMLAATGRRGGVRHGRAHAKVTAWFDWLSREYRGLLELALARPFLTIAAALALLGGTALLAPLIGTELMPSADENEVMINVEMEVGTRVEVVDEYMLAVDAAVVEAVPETVNRMSRIGGSPWRGAQSHTGNIRLNLPSRRHRSRSSEDIANALRPKLANFPGMTIRTRPGQGFFLMRMIAGGDEKLVVEIRGHDFDEGAALAARVAAAIEDIPGVSDTTVSLQSGSPEREARVNRVRAADMGMSVESVANTLRAALAGAPAGNFREDGDEHRILARVGGADKMTLDDILDLTVPNRQGVPVALRNVVEQRPALGPVMIERKNQERIIYVNANIVGRDLGSVVADAELAVVGLVVPPGFSIAFGGDREEQTRAFRELLLSFGLALALVYMVMACQFESLIDPLVVMFSVPLAGVGVVVMLLLTGSTFNVQSFIGVIMLGGIVVNNAILLVDQTNLLRSRDGMPLRGAIVEAGARRLRPILMTAATTILGLAPLAIGLGDGGEAQAPMARAVIGGLASSTLITLLLVPVIYSLLERRKPNHTAG